MVAEPQGLSPSDDDRPGPGEGDGVGTPWEGLDFRQRRAAEAYAGGATIPQVAQEIGVDRTTVWRWSKDQPFKDYVAFLDAERRRDSLSMTKQMTHVALHVVFEAARSGDVAVALAWLKMLAQHWNPDDDAV